MLSRAKNWPVRLCAPQALRICCCILVIICVRSFRGSEGRRSVVSRWTVVDVSRRLRGYDGRPGRLSGSRIRSPRRGHRCRGGQIYPRISTEESRWSAISSYRRSRRQRRSGARQRIPPLMGLRLRPF